MIVIDSTVLGPAAGGIRTRSYPGFDEALADAKALASAMTIKCALAGLAAGGGKCVVMDCDGLDRQASFEHLGEIIERLGGAFRTAGDLGTTSEDLMAAARHCSYIHTAGVELSSAVARGLVGCVRACAETKQIQMSDLSVAVQGCGSIGKAVASALVATGCRVVVADLDSVRAAEVADDAGATVVDPRKILLEDVDVIAPCATGGVVTAEVASEMSAWALCGAANNIVAPDGVRALVDRQIAWVPDALASAGAVVEGIGRTVMGLDDRAPLIDALGETARVILMESQHRRASADEVARQRALARLASGA